MAQISNFDPSGGGFFQRMFARVAYRMTRQRVGRVVVPVQVMAHHPRLLWGYGQMDDAIKGGGKVDASLLSLVQLRAATLIGCPF